MYSIKSNLNVLQLEHKKTINTNITQLIIRKKNIAFC